MSDKTQKAIDKRESEKAKKAAKEKGAAQGHA